MLLTGAMTTYNMQRRVASEECNPHISFGSMSSRQNSFSSGPLSMPCTAGQQLISWAVEQEGAMILHSVRTAAV